MSAPTVSLRVLPGRYAVCRQPADAPLVVPAVSEFFAMTRTSTELSVVCTEPLAPEGAIVEPGWAVLEVAGPLDFALTGILASLTAPLATAGVSVFAVSTYDTDYVLVRADALDAAIQCLLDAGHAIPS